MTAMEDIILGTSLLLSSLSLNHSISLLPSLSHSYYGILLFISVLVSFPLLLLSWYLLPFSALLVLSLSTLLVSSSSPFLFFLVLTLPPPPGPYPSCLIYPGTLSSPSFSPSTLPSPPRVSWYRPLPHLPAPYRLVPPTLTNC